MSDMIRNSSPKAQTRLHMAKRQALVMRIVNSTTKSLSYQEIADKMREDAWVQGLWPEYSASTARNDFLEATELVRNDVEALAGQYLVRQLGIIEEVIDVTMDMIRDKLDVDEDGNPRKGGERLRLSPATRLKAINALGPYLEKEIKIFSNYAPKEVRIDKRELVVDLDSFKEMMQEATRALEEPGEQGDVVEGELVSS